MKSCFFIGHSVVPEELYPYLMEAIERHIVEYGVEYFLVGHYGGFDRMVIKALRETKKQFPHITAMLLLPYHPAQRPIETPEGFDGTYYPEGMETVPMPLHIVAANRKAVTDSDYLIAYTYRAASRSAKVSDYAVRCKKAVTFLPECEKGLPG